MRITENLAKWSSCRRSRCRFVNSLLTPFTTTITKTQIFGKYNKKCVYITPIFQSISRPLPILSDGGDNLQSQILKKGGRSGKKMRAWAVLKSPCHRYFPVGLTMFLAKKDFVKWSMVLRAKFPDVNLGMF